MSKQARLFVGCAGWSIPKDEQQHFPEAPSHLERYAQIFSGVEINSTFYREHKPETYARWRDSVPAGFRFSLKTPKTITHERRLQGGEELVEKFIRESAGLGRNLGCLLVQLPPSLEFNPEVAARFFKMMRAQTRVPIACEPRHASWFKSGADSLLAKLKVARVAADPARAEAGSEPGGYMDFSYYRLHGSPRMYYSAYSKTFIAGLAKQIRKDIAAKRKVWCVFDNTTLGFATANARDFLSRLS